jgi:hypothetical protein
VIKSIEERKEDYLGKFPAGFTDLATLVTKHPSLPNRRPTILRSDLFDFLRNSEDPGETFDQMLIRASFGPEEIPLGFLANIAYRQVIRLKYPTDYPLDLFLKSNPGEKVRVYQIFKRTVIGPSATSLMTILTQHVKNKKPLNDLFWEINIKHNELVMLGLFAQYLAEIVSGTRYFDTYMNFMAAVAKQVIPELRNPESAVITSEWLAQIEKYGLTEFVWFENFFTSSLSDITFNRGNEFYDEVIVAKKFPRESDISLVPYAERIEGLPEDVSSYPKVQIDLVHVLNEILLHIQKREPDIDWLKENIDRLLAELTTVVKRTLTKRIINFQYTPHQRESAIEDKINSALNIVKFAAERKTMIWLFAACVALLQLYAILIMLYHLTISKFDLVSSEG